MQKYVLCENFIFRSFLPSTLHPRKQLNSTKEIKRSRYTGLAINNNLGAFNIFILKGIS